VIIGIGHAELIHPEGGLGKKSPGCVFWTRAATSLAYVTASSDDMPAGGSDSSLTVCEGVSVDEPVAVEEGVPAVEAVQAGEAVPAVEDVQVGEPVALEEAVPVGVVTGVEGIGVVTGVEGIGVVTGVEGIGVGVVAPPP
jgi:hypothetical protein